MYVYDNNQNLKVNLEGDSSLILALDAKGGQFLDAEGIILTSG